MVLCGGGGAKWGKADAETHFPATVPGALAQCSCRAERVPGRGVDSEGLVEWARSARARVERRMGDGRLERCEWGFGWVGMGLLMAWHFYM